MDLHASIELYDRNSQPKVRTWLDLVIECNQSELPYVFFESHAESNRDDPKIWGINSSDIQISTDGTRSTYSVSLISAFDLDVHQFKTAPRVSRTFSKCVRKGSKLELSGVDAYSHLVLPLVKALSHLGTAESHERQWAYYDAHLSVAVGVLDAPMVIARSGEHGTTIEPVDWVRVLRHEYVKQTSKVDRDRHWSVDIVHRTFFREYLQSYLEPFAEEFADYASRHQEEIMTGKGFVAGLETDGFLNIEKRLKPR